MGRTGGLYFANGRRRSEGGEAGDAVKWTALDENEPPRADRGKIAQTGRNGHTYGSVRRSLDDVRNRTGQRPLVHSNMNKNWNRWVGCFSPRSTTDARRNATTSTRRITPRLHLETLEDRLAPATFTWSGAGGNGLWSNPANWVGNSAPKGTA